MTGKRRKRGEVFQLVFEELRKFQASDLVMLSAGGVEERLCAMRALCSRLPLIDDVHVHLVNPGAFLQVSATDKTPFITAASEPCGNASARDSAGDPLVQVRMTGRPLYVDCGAAGMLAEETARDGGEHLRAAYFVPLIVPEGVIGVVQAATAAPGGIPSAVRKVLDLLAPPFAMTIENAWRSQAKSTNALTACKGAGRADLDGMPPVPEYNVARVAHDIKNAMTTISTFMQLLPGKWDDPHFRATFYPITREATHQVNQLINALLDRGKTAPMRREAVDIRKLLVRLVAAKAPLAEQRGLRLKTRFSLTSAVTLLNEETIKEALTNLIHNALEATPDAGVITIRLEDMVLPGGRPAIKLEIQDSGPGIAEDMLATLFDPYTSSKTGDQLAGGTGLGLYIAQRHIQAHGGMIEVESSNVPGALFRVILPVERRVT